MISSRFKRVQLHHKIIQTLTSQFSTPHKKKYLEAFKTLLNHEDMTLYIYIYMSSQNEGFDGFVLKSAVNDFFFII